MKIIVDEAISFAEEAFSQFGEVVLFAGREITNNICKNADALITRSITEVNASLLDGSNIKFVGTATIGTDHIDLKYLNKKEIAFASAAGCNADAVTEYVFTAISELLIKYKLKINELTIGVIGCGNIGSRIARLAKIAGFNVLVNDPPLEKKTGDPRFIELDDVLQSDIVTFHVPLNMGGVDNTYHLIDETKLNRIKDGAIIINTARGSVVKNSALLKNIPQKNFKTILDVWENEPHLNSELLKLVEFGTPHIAGYSYEGKVNGTKIIYDALCDFLNSEKTWSPCLPQVENNLLEVDTDLPVENVLHTIFNSIYKIKNEDKDLRMILNLTEENRVPYFDLLRKRYKLRREFSNYNIKFIKNNADLQNLLSAFRFNTEQ